MSKKAKIIIAAVNVLLLIVAVLCTLQCGTISKTLLSQQAAERWKGEREERFAQVSCYFPAGKEKSKDEIQTFRDTLDKKLVDAGVEKPAVGSLWTDAYVCTSTAQTAGERGSSEALVYGVGGDFFLFHPYKLLSGSYFDENDTMQDRVVIDRELAWKLFGGTQLEGLSITISDKQYYIAGVIERDTDKFSQRCYAEEPMVFMQASALDGTEQKLTASSYELVMNDPISGFVKQTVLEGIGKDDAIVVENSARYDFTEIFSIFENFGARSLRAEAVAFPCWENAARLTEDYIARLYVIIALLLVFPLICAVLLLIKLIKLLVQTLNRLSAAGKAAWEDRYGIQEQLREKRAAKKAAQAEKPKKEKRLKRKKVSLAQPETVPQQSPVPEQDFMADVESIVREVLNEDKK